MYHLQTIIVLLAMLMLSEPLRAQQKPRPPLGAQLIKQLRLVKKVYSTDLRGARTALQKKQLAEKLTQDGMASKDPAGKYALFQTAKELYIKGGNFRGAFQVIDTTGKYFQINTLKEKFNVLEQGTASRLKNEQYKQIFLLIRPLIDQCLYYNNYHFASELGTLAQKTAAKTHSKSFEVTAQDYNLEINSLKMKYDYFLQQKKELIASPNDKVLNLEVGRFLCFIKNDWKEGLKLMARGGNHRLSKIANMELQKTPDALAVGNAWWEASKKLTELSARNVRRHAALWYRKALPSLEGLVKMNVERKLSELNPSDAITATLIDPKKYSRIIAQDKHIGKAGDRKEDNVYVLDFPYPVAINDLRLRIKGQPAQLNQTSNGDIFISVDDGEWIKVSGWSTETSIYSQKFKGWLELSLKTAETKLVHQLRVMFVYRTGKAAFVIYHVGCVQ